MAGTTPSDEKNEKKITIYTDGASRGNPGPGGWAATMQFPNGRIIELGGAEGHTTNNRMELTGILKALEYMRDHLGTATVVEINSDSAYALNGITKWVYGWFKNNWQTADGQPVANRDLWEPMYQLVWYFKSKCELIFTKVSGHSGVLGNERADLIATSFADGERILLYVGGSKDYERLLGDSVGDRSLATEMNAQQDEQRRNQNREKKIRSTTPAYSYVSQVGGMIETHRTWADCEARVKGKSGAKFKKALSEQEEANIILEWTTGK
ncbi:MAG TPA: ribonuclease HI [Candidatus Paceibacterota bacterium]|nr:ribonuclease HI [Candidatus Paceibacterota bacterium]